MTACKIRLMNMFLKHLEDECQKSILEDLFTESNPPSQKAGSSATKDTSQSAKLHGGQTTQNNSNAKDAGGASASGTTTSGAEKTTVASSIDPS